MVTNYVTIVLGELTQMWYTVTTRRVETNHRSLHQTQGASTYTLHEGLPELCRGLHRTALVTIYEAKLRHKRLIFTPSYDRPTGLFCYGVAHIIHHLFDLRQRDLLRIIFHMHRLSGNIDFDLLHAFHLANCALNGMLAMLTLNVGSDKGCRFHESFLTQTC